MRLKMNLLENAYDFINSSLLFFNYAQETESYWKVAFINLVQALELMSKEKLRRVNNILVFENIDRPKNTISLSLALDRMVNIADIPLETKDIIKVKKAIEIRNQMMHYEIDLSIYELQAKYSELFEFVTSFHFRFLGSELHFYIEESYWEEEAYLMEFFKNEFVTYNNIEVYREYPSEILESQSIKQYIFDDEVYQRIKYGDEQYKDIVVTDKTRKCHDCGVSFGQYHVLGCDWEQCPKCLGQAISCGCRKDM